MRSLRHGILARRVSRFESAEGNMLHEMARTRNEIVTNLASQLLNTYALMRTICNLDLPSW